MFIKMLHSVSVKVIQQNPAGVARSLTQAQQSSCKGARSVDEDDEPSTSIQMSTSTDAGPLPGPERKSSSGWETHGDHTQEEGVRLFRSMVSIKSALISING